MVRRRWIAAAISAVVVLGGAGGAVATSGIDIDSGEGAELACENGMSRLGHVLDENASVFPGDPCQTSKSSPPFRNYGYLVELVHAGTHTGTHIDAPGHFIEGGRTIDDLDAAEFVWPAYVIDVRPRMKATGHDAFQLRRTDILQYERRWGTHPPRCDGHHPDRIRRVLRHRGVLW